MLVHRAVLVAPERVGPELDEAFLIGGDLEGRDKRTISRSAVNGCETVLRVSTGNIVRFLQI
jgi:hypothetical protein